MQPFKTITALAAPLDRTNVDTDQIIPKQFLKRIERTGYGDFLFFDWRRTASGEQDPNFELNDLLGALVKDPNDPSQVGGVLGNAALKYLLEARVRCLLGTDADGVEHSDIVKEYEYASSLIAYWNRTDPAFGGRSGGADEQTLFSNVRWHQTTMSSDKAEAY